MADDPERNSRNDPFPPPSIPVIGSPVGFDFAVGDWVAPNGKGTAPDLLLQLDRNSTDVTQPFEASLRISFPNADDGIQPVVAAPHVGSELRLPHEAPEQGYQPSLLKRIYRKSADQPIEKDYRDDHNWLLRVRTVKKKEKIEQANYGKIDGDIRFWPNGVLQFTYYFNPTANDRRGAKGSGRAS